MSRNPGEAAAHARPGGQRLDQDEINRQPRSGKNWHSTGMKLLDLQKVDDDLARWLPNKSYLLTGEKEDL